MTTELSTMNLSELESIVERGLASFIEVGNALIEIRDAKMYGSEYATFEHYCNERFGISNSRAYQLIEATNTVAVLSTLVEADSLPVMETHVRALQNATSDPKEQAKLLKKAARSAPKDKNGKPKITAAAIKKASAVSDPEADRKAAIMGAQATTERKSQFDPNEFDAAMTEAAEDDKPTNVPKHLREIADSCKEFAACVSEAGRLKGRIEKLTAGPGGGKLAKWWTDIDRCLSQTQTYLKCYRFWAACPECKITDKHTKPAKDCKLCGGHGWIAESNGLSDIHKDWLRERGVKV
jgi:hypothetical protein